MSPLELAYNYAQYTHRNIFLTGKAGTGKTTFLRQLRKQTHKRMIVVAPTGVAAINAGGVTIHSFFQLAPGMFLPQHLAPGMGPTQAVKKQKFSFSKHKLNILRSLDLLVIDEISMVRCDLLDAIDEILRRYQDRHRPFGGVQLLMIGDLQQLAPVTTENEWQILRQYYRSPYFFESLALNQTHYTTIELQHVFRQADPTFIRVLNNVRSGHLDSETLRILSSRCNPNFRPRDDEGYITLTTHNYQAQDLNTLRMLQLNTPEVIYSAQVKDDFPETSYPTDAQLTLKVGAQVMFCKNDPSPTEKRYYNGKIGRVVRCEKGRVWVDCPDDDDTIEVVAQEWQNTKYITNEKTGEITEVVAGSFTQIPLKAAWAITIHKSQGLTFERAIINAGKAFSYGQVYVALSRCRTLEGLVLTTPITPDVVTNDPEVIRYNQFMEHNQPDDAQLQNDKLGFVADVLCRIFDFQPMQRRFDYIVRLAEEHLSRQQPDFVRQSKALQQLMDAQLTQVGIRFIRQIMQLMPQAPTYEANATLQERVAKGMKYYLQNTVELLQDYITQGLPEIGNKAHREQLEREFQMLADDYQLKTQVFTKCISDFSLDHYWQAKAVASMNTSADKTDANKKPAAKSRARSRKRDV